MLLSLKPENNAEKQKSEMKGSISRKHVMVLDHMLHTKTDTETNRVGRMNQKDLYKYSRSTFKSTKILCKNLYFDLLDIYKRTLQNI